MSNDNIIQFPFDTRQKINTPKEVTVDDLIKQNTDEDGVVDVVGIQNAPALGWNGGIKCDVTKGPCNCGAWH